MLASVPFSERPDAVSMLYIYDMALMLSTRKFVFWVVRVFFGEAMR